MTNSELERLPDLNDIDIKDCIKRFKNDNQASEKAVSSVFAQYNNSEISDVLIKVIVINSCYNTRLNNNPSTSDSRNVNLTVDVYTMSRNIAERQKEISKYVEEKDKISLVEELKIIGKKYKMAYSFVSKYFYWEYPDMDIYMVDQYVKGILYYYNRKTHYTNSFTRGDLDNYSKFCSAYEAFFTTLIKENNYKFKNTREKDMFLWRFAKDLENKGLKIVI